MNFFEGIVQLGASVVDTATAIVTYPVDVITEGFDDATLNTVGEIAGEVANVGDVLAQSPLSAAAVAIIAQ